MLTSRSESIRRLLDDQPVDFRRCDLLFLRHLCRIRATSSRSVTLVDPLSTGASAVTILDRIAAVVRWVLRRPKRELPPGRPALGVRHSGLEVRPVHYAIELTRNLPAVEVELLAINYLRHPLSLRDLKITRFTGGGIPVAIDNIPLALEVTIEPQSSFLVTCARALADSEARVIATTKPETVYGGSVNITAHGIARGKEYNFSASALKIDGRVR